MKEIHPLFENIIAAHFPGIYDPYECDCGCGKKLDPDAAVYYRKGRESHAFINEAHMRAFWELEDETEAKVALEVMRERDEEYHRWFGGGDDE